MQLRHEVVVCLLDVGRDAFIHMSSFAQAVLHNSMFVVHVQVLRCLRAVVDLIFFVEQ